MKNVSLDLRRRFNFFFRGFRKYEIWEEGYLCIGQEAHARLLGCGYGRNFKEACEDYMKHHPNSNMWVINPEEKMGGYACKIFDNEVDARKSFG